MSYSFQAYDVLQIEQPNADTQITQWLDFSTIRTQDEASQAVLLVRVAQWNGRPARFRIVRYVPGAGNQPVLV